MWNPKMTGSRFQNHPWDAGEFWVPCEWARKRWLKGERNDPANEEEKRFSQKSFEAALPHGGD
jgi:hypothetical protein